MLIEKLSTFSTAQIYIVLLCAALSSLGTFLLLLTKISAYIWPHFLTGYFLGIYMISLEKEEQFLSF